MNEKMVMELYSKDISRIKLPPVSEKVLHAMREKKEKEENTSDKSGHHPSSSGVRMKTPVKYIFAALIIFLIASVPIIVILTNNTSVPVVPEESADTGESSNVSAAGESSNVSAAGESSNVSAAGESSNVSAVKEDEEIPYGSEDDIERIKKQQLYGAVSLSGKNEKELDELLLTYNDASKVYEDESFIYNFDSSGDLTEIVNKGSADENSSDVSEQEIKDKTRELISRFLPEWKDTSYEMNIQENKDAYPAWTAEITKKDSVFTEEAVITYDADGSIIRLILAGMGDDIGSVSREEALDIALKEIRSGKYDIPEFETDDVRITIENKSGENGSCYFILIDGIKLDHDIMTYVGIMIDSRTGKVLDIEY